MSYNVHTCGRCNGLGVYANAYGDPVECPPSVVVYPNGAVAVYPGGPFTDAWPAESAVAIEEPSHVG